MKRPTWTLCLVATTIALTSCASADDARDQPTTSSTSQSGTSSSNGQDTEHWAYSGEHGPDHWGDMAGFETCATGPQQSPIDLRDADATSLRNIAVDYTASSASMTNNGHTVQSEVDPGGSITVDGTTYDLMQFHYHAPSEHKLNGVSFAAEFHLVHQAEEDQSLAVVGALITPGAENLALADSLGDYPGAAGETTVSTGTVDPADLLPPERMTYRYDGSLTTPPCSEGVTWLVMADPVTASPEQLARLTELYDANNRPVQPSNARELRLDTSLDS